MVISELAGKLNLNFQILTLYEILNEITENPLEFI